MAVDLRDVARHSGVSVSTASRALRGSGRVSPATEARVRAAAAALAYRPNASARALRTARSGFVGLVVTNLVNTSFHTIAEVVQHELARRGFQLMLAVTAGTPPPNGRHCGPWPSTAPPALSWSAPTTARARTCARSASRRSTWPAVRRTWQATACSATTSPGRGGGRAPARPRPPPDRDHRRAGRRAVWPGADGRVLAGDARRGDRPGRRPRGGGRAVTGRRGRGGRDAARAAARPPADRADHRQPRGRLRRASRAARPRPSRCPRSCR